MGVLEIIIAGVLVACWLTAIVTSFMKGHWVYGLIGIPIFVVAVIGALMPPKPNSRWVKRAANTP